MGAGLVKGEGLAVDARVMEADARRYPGEAPARSIGQHPSARRARSPRSCLVLTMKIPARTANRRR
jgi:hypothetical protein